MICFAGGAAAAAAAAPNQSSAVAKVVRVGLQKELDNRARQDQAKYRGLTFTVTAVNCLQVKHTTVYRCVGYYTLRYGTVRYRYAAPISANVSGGTVHWQSGTGTRVG